MAAGFALGLHQPQHAARGGDGVAVHVERDDERGAESEGFVGVAAFAAADVEHAVAGAQA